MNTHRAIEAVWRFESAKLIAVLARMTRKERERRLLLGRAEKCRKE